MAMSMSAATAVMEKQKANYQRFDTYDTGVRTPLTS
jgi:hypothetical protein